MTEQVKAYMQEWEMAPAGSRVLAAVSGGADSVCLCLVLSELSAQMGFSLGVIHVEHGIRGEESRRDAAFVEQLCRERGISYQQETVEVPEYARTHGMGEEEAARILRYRALSAAAQGQEVRIALAHHLEDDAETTLFQLVRGSGIDGLCGMQPVRTDAQGVCFIRPFLSVTRAQIEAELARRGQPYCTDSTNADLSFSRNRLRLCVFPELTAINAQAAEHIHAASVQLAQVRDYLARMEELIAQREIQQEDGAVWLEAPVATLHEAMKTRLIRRALVLAAGQSRDFTAAHVQAVDALFEKTSGRKLTLPYGLTAQRVYARVRIYRDQAPADICVPVFSDGELPASLTVGGWEFSFSVFPFNGKWKKIPRKNYTKWLDYDKIEKNLTIRNRRAGDFFVLDADGHHKKLGNYFVDEKVPVTQREETLVLAQEQQVLWIVGGRMAYGAGVSEDTKKILQITANKEQFA